MKVRMSRPPMYTMRRGRRALGKPRWELLDQIGSAPTVRAAAGVATRGAVEMLGAQSASAIVFDDARRQAFLVAAYPDAPAIRLLDYDALRRAAREGALDNDDSVTLFVALGDVDDPIGVLQFDRSADREGWKADDRRGLAALSRQLGNQLEQTRLRAMLRSQQQVLDQRSVALDDLIHIRDQMRLHLDPHRLLQEFALIVHRRLDRVPTLLLLVDDDGHSLQVAGAAGVEPELVARWTTSPPNWAIMAPLLQVRYRRANSYVVPREVADPILPLGGDVLLLPLLSREDRIQGLLAIESRVVRALDETLQLLEVFTSQVAVALENSRLYASQHERANELEALYETAVVLSSQLDLTKVLQMIVERAVQLVGADTGALYLLPAGAQELVLSVLYGLPESFRGMRLKVGEGLAGRAAETGRVQVTAHYRDWEGRAEQYRDEHFYAVLAVPLFEEGRVVGVLDLLHEAPGTQFQERDIHVAKLFAAQAAVAVRNARLYGEQSHRTAQLQLINQVSQRLPQSLQPDELMQQVVTLIRNAFGYYVVALGLVEEDILVFHTCAGDVDSLLPDAIRVPLRETSICSSAVQRGQSMLVADVRLDPRYRPVAGLERTRSELAIPLKTRDRVLGVLDVESADVAGIRPGDVQALETLADQIVVALTNARLYASLEQRNEELQQVNRVKTEFFANMSHELRTPMNSIIGYTDMLLEGVYGALPDPAFDPLGRVKRNAVALLEQINDLLDLSKIEAGRFVLEAQSFLFGDLIASVTEAIEPLARQKGLRFAVAVDDAVPRMMVADSSRLRQILVNLLGNAVKFTRSGSVELLCSLEDEAELPVGVGPAVVYRVRDTGIGIASDHVDFIWDAFRQVDGSVSREFGGTGLGLAIVRRLVDLMGGSVAVESKPGEGAIFTVKTPMVLPAPIAFEAL